MAEPVYCSIVRIIGGDLRGRLIEPPSGFRARPTTDYARESLFNILNNRYDFCELTVLDLFSGTGAISYEFASRGTPDIDLVEIDSRHCRFITNSLRKLNIKTVRIHHLDVKKWTDICHKRYDIIFADPPYDLSWLKEIPDMIFKSEMLKKETLLIVEHPKSVSFCDHTFFKEHRNYGNVNFSFFEKPESK